MSNTIKDAFVTKFESEVHVAYQRMGSQLRNTVRVKGPINAEKTTFQKVGKGTAGQKTRNGDVPVMNLNHTPVECVLEDWYAGEYIDDLDELKINHDERKVAVEAGAAALGRKTDTMITTVVDGATTYGSTPINLSSIVAKTLTDKVAALGARDVRVGDGNLFAPVSWEVWSHLMSIDEFVNADYVGYDQLPYQAGMQAKMWAGAMWFPFSGLTKTGNNRTCAIYHRTAIGHAIGCEIKTDISWENTKSSYFQNSRMSMGSCLIDTIGIEQFVVNENA